MSRKLFRVKLKAIHEKSGKSIYQAAKDAGVRYNTAKKYVTEDFETDKLSPEVTALAGSYGVDWRDPSVVEIIEVDDEEELKTPLAASA